MNCNLDRRAPLPRQSRAFAANATSCRNRLRSRADTRILARPDLRSRGWQGVGFSTGFRRMNHPAEIPSEDTLGLVKRCAGGDEAAYNQLFEMIYQDLRRRAHLQLAGRRDGTLSTTLLVHETYLKLAGSRLALNDRAHFFAIAARAMRQILINAARDRAAQKRGGGQQQVTFDQDALAAPELSHDLLGLDAAMRTLEAGDARLAQVVELHFFAGLDFARIAEMLDLSERTVARDWRAARALLRMHLEQSH